MGKSSIEWTDATWNPVTGCTRVSPGCDNCYAATLAKRLKVMGNPRYQNDGPDGPGFGVTVHRDKFHDPLRWKSPRRVFVNSMSDLFHNDVPRDAVDSVFCTMALAQKHTFQILTKRPHRMLEYLKTASPRFSIGWPPANVWLGVSVEREHYAWRIPLLKKCNPVVRFISFEPLIGRANVNAKDLRGIEWVIVGGESGPGRRRCDPNWVREIRDAAKEAGAAFFFKQWGAHRPRSGGRQLDGRFWSELPRRELT